MSVAQWFGNIIAATAMAAGCCCLMYHGKQEFAEAR
jgi:hypothetical protein